MNHYKSYTVVVFFNLFIFKSIATEVGLEICLAGLHQQGFREVVGPHNFLDFSFGFSVIDFSKWLQRIEVVSV